jgi:hypothetical protein
MVAETEYRIEEITGGFEPQMRYMAGATGEVCWFPLLSTGYWAEPDAYSYGNIMIRSPMHTREDAERAIERAKAINACSPFPRRLAPETEWEGE